MIKFYNYDSIKNRMTLLYKLDGEQLDVISPAAPIVIIKYDELRLFEWQRCNLIYLDIYNMFYKITSAEILPGVDIKIELAADTTIRPD